jgi:hypothetical protein
MLVCTIIKNYFNLRDVKNMFYVNVVDYIYNTTKNVILSKCNLKKFRRNLENYLISLLKKHVFENI